MRAASAWARAVSASPSLCAMESPPGWKWSSPVSSRCLQPRRSSGSSADQALDLRNDLEQVADETVIRYFEDRRLAVLVDGDDGARVLDASEVLDRPGDSHRDVQLRRNDLAGLADLHFIRRIARIHRRARSTDRRAHAVRKAVEDLESL